MVELDTIKEIESKLIRFMAGMDESPQSIRLVREVLDNPEPDFAIARNMIGETNLRVLRDKLVEVEKREEVKSVARKKRGYFSANDVLNAFEMLDSGERLNKVAEAVNASSSLVSMWDRTRKSEGGMSVRNPYLASGMKVPNYLIRAVETNLAKSPKVESPVEVEVQSTPEKQNFPKNPNYSGRNVWVLELFGMPIIRFRKG